MNKLNYIPKDLEDCFVQLKKLFSVADLAQVKIAGTQVIARFHFTWGKQLRNMWGLWNDSRLAKWFNERGIYHADDMSGIIMHSFWRRLNDMPLELEDQILSYQNYWAERGVTFDEEKKK